MTRSKRMKLYLEILAESGPNGLTTEEVARVMTEKNPSDPISKWAANRLKNAARDDVVRLPGRRYAVLGSAPGGHGPLPKKMNPGDRDVYEEILKSGAGGTTTAAVDQKLGYPPNRRVNYAFSRLSRIGLTVRVGRAEDGKGLYAAATAVEKPNKVATEGPEERGRTGEERSRPDGVAPKAEGPQPGRIEVRRGETTVTTVLPSDATPEFVAEVTSRILALGLGPMGEEKRGP